MCESQDVLIRRAVDERDPVAWGVVVGAEASRASLLVELRRRSALNGFVAADWEAVCETWRVVEDGLACLDVRQIAVLDWIRLVFRDRLAKRALVRECLDEVVISRGQGAAWGRLRADAALLPMLKEQIAQRPELCPRNTVRRVLKDLPGEVDEVVQEVWIKFFDKLPDYDPQRGSLRDLLRGIARFTARKRRTKVMQARAEPAAQPEAVAEAPDGVWQQMGDLLDDQEMNVVIYVFQYEMTESEAAELLGLTRRQVHLRKKSAMEKLARRLGVPFAED